MVQQTQFHQESSRGKMATIYQDSEYLLMGNPDKPPKEWWDRHYEHIRKSYSRPSGRRRRITSKKKLSSITASIWWGLTEQRRASIVDYYSSKVNPARNPVVHVHRNPAGPMKNNPASDSQGVACPDCGNYMLDPETESCTWPYIVNVRGVYYKRDTQYYDKNERCHDCGILNKPGNIHHFGCDMERTPRGKHIEQIFLEGGWVKLAKDKKGGKTKKLNRNPIMNKNNPEERYNLNQAKMKILRQQVRLHWMRALKWEQEDPNIREKFVGFSPDNPHIAHYDKFMKQYLALLDAMGYGRTSYGRNPRPGQDMAQLPHIPDHSGQEMSDMTDHNPQDEVRASIGWNALSQTARANILFATKLSRDFSDYSWKQLPGWVQRTIQANTWRRSGNKLMISANPFMTEAVGGVALGAGWTLGGNVIKGITAKWNASREKARNKKK